MPLPTTFFFPPKKPFHGCYIPWPTWYKAHPVGDCLGSADIVPTAERSALPIH